MYNKKSDEQDPRKFTLSGLWPYTAEDGRKGLSGQVARGWKIIILPNRNRKTPNSPVCVVYLVPTGAAPATTRADENVLESMMQGFPEGADGDNSDQDEAPVDYAELLRDFDS